ncbi:MAG: glutathione S-transferase family protein [Pseudomonadota bacterium]
MIRLYYHHTPNPLKVALFLEESGLAYEVAPVDMYKGEQHRPEFRRINPNGKLPAIEDDGAPVFDSTAILLYLAEKTGRFMGAAGKRGEMLSWLLFVASGVGPYSGQAVHFTRVHTDSPYAANRYRREVERLYGVLDERLAGREFIAADDYTIVDMAAWGWIDRAPFILNSETPLDATPNLKRWFGRVNARPAAIRARKVGHDVAFKTEFDEETLRALFPQNYAKA